MSAVTPAGGDTTADRSWPALLNGLLDGRDLSADDTAWALDVIMRGEATDVQIAGFAVGLRFKGRRSRRSPDWSAPCTNTPT